MLQVEKLIYNLNFIAAENAKIRNCLASFESLETELIPAITTFYLHPTNQEMQLCVKLLTNQWQFEMKEFHHSINLIIDPTAYCQVKNYLMLEMTNTEST